MARRQALAVSGQAWGRPGGSDGAGQTGRSGGLPRTWGASVANVGTPSASNLYVRTLLGPRAFFARLRALAPAPHLRAAEQMVARFDVVAPTHRLAAVGPLLRDRLGWRRWEMPRKPIYADQVMRHIHQMIAPVRPALLEVAGAALREHNQLDLALYRTVGARFEADLASVRPSAVA